MKSIVKLGCAPRPAVDLVEVAADTALDVTASNEAGWLAGAALALAAALAGCDGAPAGAPAACAIADRAAGLVPLSYAYVDANEDRWGHSRELLIDGDLLFVADANGMPVLRWNEGALQLVRGIEQPRTHHCSTIAMHASSRTLVCAAADWRLITLEDVRDPASPVSRSWSVDDIPETLLSVKDVTIAGDTVWMATDLGLLRTTLDANGRPAPLEQTGVGGDAVQVEMAGDRLVVLDRAEGLLVLDPSTLERLGSATLDGPPLDLAVDGDRLVVSLGSEGARVLRLDGDGRPEPIASVQPRCVATASDLEGDQLAVGCLSGVTLYDLSGAAPRVAGFAASRYGILDVGFAPYGLVVVDWFRVDVFTTDIAGSVLVPEVPRGMRLAAGADARVPIRNPGEEPLDIAWTLRPEGGGAVRSGRVTLAPGAEAVIELERADLEAAGSASNRAEIVFSSDGNADCDGPRTRLWHRGPEDQVGVGDTFGPLSRTVDSPAPETLPHAGAETLLMFLTVDCYLQWPQLEDMAWAQDHASGQAAPTILFLTPTDEDPFDPTQFMQAFDAERLLTVEWADYHHSVDESEANPIRSFEQNFHLDLPGADFPHDYHLDASGTVTATSRVFRGRWPLGE